YCDSLSFSLHRSSTTQLFTLSLHDALPIYRLVERYRLRGRLAHHDGARREAVPVHHVERRQRVADRAEIGADDKQRHEARPLQRDRKSTRLNSSHVKISYAVFCLKKKKIKV